MSNYLTEEQQVEALKKFWKEHGFSIIVSIIIAVLTVTGIRFYRGYVHSRAEHASLVYYRMMDANTQGKTKEVLTDAHTLIDHYHATPYSKLAALMLAKHFATQKQYDQAATELKWVMKHAHTKAFSQIARIRLARITIQNNQPANALKTLEKVDDNTYIGLVNEVRGDAYVALNNHTAASKAYRQALNDYKKANIARPLLELKLHDLPN